MITRSNLAEQLREYQIRSKYDWASVSFFSSNYNLNSRYLWAGQWRKRKKGGHFVVYTKEGKRFCVPLYYLNHPIFRVLLEMADEEFGLTAHGPLKVPCEEEFMNYILCLLRKNPPQQVDHALLSVTSFSKPTTTAS